MEGEGRPGEVRTVGLFTGSVGLFTGFRGGGGGGTPASRLLGGLLGLISFGEFCVVVVVVVVVVVCVGTPDAVAASASSSPQLATAGLRGLSRKAFTRSSALRAALVFLLPFVLALLGDESEVPLAESRKFDLARRFSSNSAFRAARCFLFW